MLNYDNKQCSLRLLLTMSGSVFPQAAMVAIPNVVVTLACAHVFQLFYSVSPEQSASSGQLWRNYNIAVSLLLVFRTQQAYSRWWEGGSLLKQIRGEWYNAASSLIAFSSNDFNKIDDVKHFQHLMVRLMSMLHCSALQQIAMMEDTNFEIIDNEGVDVDKLEFLRHSHDRCEVLLQWIQRLIVDNMASGVLSIPAPVISRVFQELSRGIVNVNNVKKIKHLPFPFPYAQMVTLLLIIHWVLTPVANVVLVDNVYYSGILSFVSVFAFWGINYIAVEVETPFGNAVNDLPIAQMQKDMNRSLLILLDQRVQEPPSFDFRRSFHQRASFKKAQTMDEQDFERNLGDSWPGLVRKKDSERKMRRAMSIQSRRGSMWGRPDLGDHDVPRPSVQMHDRWDARDSVSSGTSRSSWRPGSDAASHVMSTSVPEDGELVCISPRQRSTYSAGGVSRSSGASAIGAARHSSAPGLEVPGADQPGLQAPCLLSETPAAQPDEARNGPPPSPRLLSDLPRQGDTLAEGRLLSDLPRQGGAPAEGPRRSDASSMHQLLHGHSTSPRSI